MSVTKSDTIGFRIYPHYKGGYINLGKARDTNGLMRKLLYYSDQNFLFWGADDTADVFCGYTVTLESGFPVGCDRRDPAQHQEHRQVRRRDAPVHRRHDVATLTPERARRAAVGFVVSGARRSIARWNSTATTMNAAVTSASRPALSWYCVAPASRLRRAKRTARATAARTRPTQTMTVLMLPCAITAPRSPAGAKRRHARDQHADADPERRADQHRQRDDAHADARYRERLSRSARA